MGQSLSRFFEDSWNRYAINPVVKTANASMDIAQWTVRAIGFGLIVAVLMGGVYVVGQVKNSVA